MKIYISPTPAQAGFTLLETVVTTVIVTIMTAILLVALPSVRDDQALLYSKQQLQFLLRDAQKRALNEEREENCLNEARGRLVEERRCSDVGVYMDDATLVLFADLSGDGRYTSTDYIVQQVALVSDVHVVEQQSLLFTATPPTIILLVNGVRESSLNPGQVTLERGSNRLALRVDSYGQLEVR